MYKGKHPRPQKPRPKVWRVRPKPDKRDIPKSKANTARAYITRLRIAKTSYNEFTNRYSAVRVISRTPGGSVSNWRRRIVDHVSATSPFQATKCEHQFKNFYAKGRYHDPLEPEPAENSFIGTLSGNVEENWSLSLVPTTPPSFSGATYTSAYNLAVQKLYDQIRAAESSVNTGEDFGEYHQTINLFKRGLGGLQDMIQHVSQRHHDILNKAATWNNVKRTAKSLADLTLEYRFGISPLAKDLGEGAAAIVSDRYLDAFIPFRAKGKATSTHVVEEGRSNSYPRCHYLHATYEQQYVRFKGEYRVRGDGGKTNYLRSLGLTWREAVPTLYNLFPYSFLIDYVLNLHTFVEALAVPWTNVAWCVQTERSTNGWNGSFDFRQADQFQNFSLQTQAPGYYRSMATGIRRSDVTSIPFPVLQWHAPSVRQLENTLALVAGRLPIIGSLTKRLLRSPSGRDLNYKFNLAVRDRNLKVPYPYHRAP